MHEMSITQGIIEVCEKNASGRKVVALEVEIGVLSGVVPEAVEFCFEACSSGTLLEGAALTINRIAGRGCCLDCAAEFPVTTLYDPCTACGGFRIRITAGEEMRIREIEVED